MDRNEALQILKKHLPEKRYIHTLGVLETALDLARVYGCDEKKTELAAIFHDYAKYRPEEEMRNIIIQEHFPEDLLHYHSELWHAPAGAYLVKKELGIDDKDIFQAIYYHTTGRPGMTLIEKIIFIADYIEPGRQFPGVDEVRALAKKNLDDAILQASRNTIAFLMKKNAPIYPDTFHTYNHFLMKKEESSIHE
ncbi:bis(5'-nucleosyl)-tetraphosphatase (symmetrical) YqeK [Caldibacillus lycopersici]|uniref:bis(5'-nucleosyl)-tetraphosphatase (symmetrical) n=1 Tax=Perspicuibacillus lycopersici TaxID=1325689 RepID=A0AAE3LTG4_9BACI|nr:bis(5'-nucleosyl)-tetraphosphatase (symmetrical) YqeK [Perspicuibacillus lycopersici]MCU9613948.1 bis(5'-nucleosyl)-tetraphosphatase (symmetrical) YqeK [Perspicuibacillus lycopersici]